MAQCSRLKHRLILSALYVLGFWVKTLIPLPSFFSKIKIVVILAFYLAHNPFHLAFALYHASHAHVWGNHWSLKYDYYDGLSNVHGPGGILDYTRIWLAEDRRRAPVLLSCVRVCVRVVCACVTWQIEFPPNTCHRFATLVTLNTWMSWSNFNLQPIPAGPVPMQFPLP